MEEEKRRKGLSKEQYSLILILTGVVLVTLIAVVSLLRQRWVNPIRNQVTVYGESKIEVQPDTAKIILGIKIDKAPTAQEALKQLNSKMKKIIRAILAIGIAKDDIKTETYKLDPTYEYNEGVRRVVGYNAQEKLVIKIKGVDKNNQLVSRVMAVAGDAGSNEIEGVSYYVENLNDIRQKALIMAIQDARKKAQGLAQAAGIKKLTKVISWQEGDQSAIQPNRYENEYMNKLESTPLIENKVYPQISAGTQEIKVRVGVNFAVN